MYSQKCAIVKPKCKQVRHKLTSSENLGDKSVRFIHREKFPSTNSGVNGTNDYGVRYQSISIKCVCEENYCTLFPTGRALTLKTSNAQLNTYTWEVIEIER